MSSMFGSMANRCLGLFLPWATLPGYTQFFPLIGLYVVMLAVIIIQFLWFAPVLVVLICSFALPFYILLQIQSRFDAINFAWIRSDELLHSSSSKITNNSAKKWKNKRKMTYLEIVETSWCRRYWYLASFSRQENN
jgi:hypothetical protein